MCSSDLLNQAWRTLPVGTPNFDGSWRGRLGRLVWQLVGPALEQQQQFNSAVVEHLNRNVAAHEQGVAALTALVQTMKAHVDGLEQFESRLLAYLRTVTAYVDTKDRGLGGTEIRQRLALNEQRVLAIKRDVDRLRGDGASAPSTAALSAAAAPAEGAAAPATSAGAHDALAFTGSVDSLTYVAFEDQFRGSQDEIRRRVEDYVPVFLGASNVLDVGCGRGELLAALHERGVSARGIDVSPAMVALCRQRGFHVDLGDALEYVSSQPDGSLGGLVAVQVVEHFTPAYLTRFLEAAYHAMAPGAPLVLETINPNCWMAFFETYIQIGRAHV